MLDSTCREPFQRFFDLLAKGLLTLNFTPNQVTLSALISGCISALAISRGKLFLGLILILLSGLLDVLDGSMARLNGTSSNIGAYMDLIFDRMVEAAFIIGFYIFKPEMGLPCLFFCAGSMFNFSSFMLAGSLMKNTGKKSIHYDVGLIERTEAFICFTLMLLFSNYSFLLLSILNFLLFYTGCARMYRIIKWERNNH